MKKVSRTLGLVLAGSIMFSTVLAGCGGNKNKADNPGASATPSGTAGTSNMPDTSKPLELKGYMIATNVPKLWDEVQAEVNKMLSAKVNTTMQVSVIPQGDAKTKFPMINASGESYDFMYTANWLGTYGGEVAKGAYEEINEDMLKRLMPKYYAAVDKDNIQAMLINGKMYCLPQTVSAVNPTGIAVRKDLREKYGMGPIKDNADLEKYMEMVLKNEPGMIPYNLSKVEANTGIFDSYFTEYFGDFMYSLPGLNTVQTPYEDEKGKVYSLLDKEYFDAFKKASAKMKELYDKGYFPKNPFGNTIRSGELLIQGKSAIARMGLSDFALNYVKAKGNNYALEFYPIKSSKGRILKPVAAQGVVIKAGNKNVERILMAMDYIYEDPEIVETLEYGIKGKSYVVTGDGKVDFPEGINSANAPYSQGAVSFWFTDNAFKKPMASWPQQKIDLEKEYSNKAVAPVLNSLSLNLDSVKTELASIRNLDDVEGNSLKVGMVDDVDAMLDTYVKKLKSAGYERLVEEATKQAAEFVKNKK